MYFETAIANAMKPVHLVALGRTSKNVGPGMISVPDLQWQTTFSSLAERSQSILMIPSLEPGIFWELESLMKNGGYSKCVFVQPPGVGLKSWQKVVEAVAKAGLTLPPYETRGQLFILNADGMFATRAALDKVIWSGQIASTCKSF